MTTISQLFSRWSGGLGRPLTGDRAIVPLNLELRGARLVYSEEGQLKRVDTSRLLDRFVALANRQSTDRDVVEFAKQYGPLYLCEHHGLASYHKPVLLNFSAVGPAPIIGVDQPFKYDICAPKLERRNPKTLSEPVQRWRELATRAKNLLLVANAVRLEGSASPELWQQVDGFRDGFAKRYGSFWAFLDKPWPRLAANLDWWIVAADVCLRVQAAEQSLVARLGSNPFTRSVFSLVAIQLLLAITRSEGLTSCAGCGAPFVSGRPPLAGKRVGKSIARRNYCQDCRDSKIPQRDAARDYRKRNHRRLLLN